MLWLAGDHSPILSRLVDAATKAVQDFGKHSADFTEPS
jgi:hypothetical protein